jgi:nicotinamidase-related amidase
MTAVVRTPYLMLTTPRPWLLIPDQTAVVTIDFDGWAMCPECGILGGAKLRGIDAEFVDYRSTLAGAVQNLEALVHHAHEAGCYVVAMHRPDPTDRNDIGQIGAGECLAAHAELDRGVEHIPRSSTSIFLDTPLEARLRERGMATVVLCGTLANRTVRLAAYEALDRGFFPFVVIDASVSESSDWHALFAMEINGGPMRVGSTEEARLLLRGSPG